MSQRNKSSSQSLFPLHNSFQNSTTYRGVAKLHQPTYWCHHLLHWFFLVPVFGHFGCCDIMSRTLPKWKLSCKSPVQCIICRGLCIFLQKSQVKSLPVCNFIICFNFHFKVYFAVKFKNILLYVCYVFLFKQKPKNDFKICITFLVASLEQIITEGSINSFYRLKRWQDGRRKYINIPSKTQDPEIFNPFFGQAVYKSSSNLN